MMVALNVVKFSKGWEIQLEPIKDILKNKESSSRD